MSSQLYIIAMINHILSMVYLYLDTHIIGHNLT